MFILRFYSYYYFAEGCLIAPTPFEKTILHSFAFQSPIMKRTSLFGVTSRTSWRSS